MIEKIDKAKDFVKEKHKGQKRKNGEPYYLHPFGVQQRLEQKGFDEDYQLAGLFHDLLEDTDATEEEIRDLSNENVLTAVKLLTKHPGYSEKDYISNILENPIAKVVKAEDRINNLLDCLDLGEDFCKRYLANTKEFYVGHFSEELDMVYEITLKLSNFSYYYDSSLLLEASPIYRTNDELTWCFNEYKQQWEKVSAYEWVYLGDNATPIDYEELKSTIQGIT